MEQKIEIIAKDPQDRKIGKFIIVNDNPFEDKLQNLSSNKIDNCNLYNIPIVDDFEDSNLVFSSIVYNTSDIFSNILLLEEVNYKIYFKKSSNYPIKDYELFYTLQKEYTQFKPLDLFNPTEGYLNFRSYVGKSFIDIKYNGDILFSQAIEVRSKKMDYYNQYSKMIGDLSNYSSALIFFSQSPVYKEFDLDNISKKNFYEYYMFFEYLFRDENLPSAFEYISRNLHTILKEEIQSVPSALAVNVDSDSIIEMISNPENLEKTTEDYYISRQLTGYLPKELNECSYYDDIDTVENRFFKDFLETINDYINELINHSVKNDYIHDQLLKYREKMSYFLSQRFFKDISKMDYPPLNSQVLQKKEGYRDILQYFLMLEFTFRMSWNQLNENFIGYEKKLSELYELWGYFKLLEVLQDLTNSEISFESIFTENKWNLSLREGEPVSKDILIKGVPVNISLLYNKTFKRNDDFYSYSVELRPDYTFVIKINDSNYFIHFDAKYKLYMENESFKLADIHKMHTYKDAIKDSVGAFVLYPGKENQLYETNHDYKYGVGAFSLNPSYDDKNKDELVGFINRILRKLVEYESKIR